jgi:hypothetical protein
VVILSTIAAGFVVLLLSTTEIAAVSLTNRDERDHKVTVIEGDTKTDRVLKPSIALEGICPKGCVIRLDDSEDDEYQLEGADVVSIEDGFLYYDRSDVPLGQSPGSNAPGK